MLKSLFTDVKTVFSKTSGNLLSLKKYPVNNESTLKKYPVNGEGSVKKFGVKGEEASKRVSGQVK